MSKLVPTGSKYSDEDRRRTVIEYHIHGSQTKVSKLTGIPQSTIATWIKTDWWAEQLLKLSNQLEDQILANNEKIVTESQEQLLDRIENGDFRLVKTKKALKHDDGSLEVSEDYELKRIPMTGKDLTISGGTHQDKRRIQLNLPTNISSSQASDENLKKVMDKCFALGAGQAIPGTCTEIVDEVADQVLGFDTKKGKSKKIK